MCSSDLFLEERNPGTRARVAEFGGPSRFEEVVATMLRIDGPARWGVTFAVEDADAIAQKVRDAGGQVVAEPMDVMELGRMAVFTDPGGAFFGIWQAKEFSGAALVNEPGAFAWNELNTRDPEAAKSFYGAVFGWEAVDQDMGDAGTYTLFRLARSSEDDQSICGMIDIRGRAPDEVPPHWLTYFTIDSAEATIDKAKELGGQLVVGPIDFPMGRAAVLTDSQGAAFGIWQITGESS